MTGDRMQDWVIEGGWVLHSDGMREGDLFVSEGRIAEQARSCARRFDAAGCHVLPGIVDLHGDGFERIIQPRPGVVFSPAVALQEADRQLITNGITTALHGLTISWEPGLRSLDAARNFVSAYADAREVLRCDTHLNLRWETFALDAIADVTDWMQRFPGAVLSINDHTTANIGQTISSSKIGRMSTRTGLSREECLAALAEVWIRRGDVPAAIAQVCSTAKAADATIFAHDEISPDERLRNRALGITVTEFPMTLATAGAAIAANEAVVLGAPNILRGGSQNNAVCAAEAIRAGACSALASDYYYPAPLLAAYQLAETIGLASAWSFVSSSPARAVGLNDRGMLSAGFRADVILVDPVTKTIRAVFVDGRKVLELG